jgi:hypothetical protein
MQWLHQTYPTLIDVSMENECAFIVSCQYGRMDIIHWLKEINPNIKYLAQNASAFYLACENGHLNVVKFLLKEIPDIYAHIEIERSNWNFDKADKMFMTVCAKGYLEIAKILLDIRTKHITYEIHDIHSKWNISNANALYMACENKHYHIANWLIETFPYKYRIQKHPPSLFHKNGYNEYIVNTEDYEEQLIMDAKCRQMEDDMNRFIYYCESGMIEKAKDTYKTLDYKYDLTNVERHNYLLERMCKSKQPLLNNHIIIIDWIIHSFVPNPKINTIICIFKNACYNGHLELAMHLKNKYPKINISIDDEFAFRYACTNGHLDVAKWLYEVKPDINVSANNEHAYRYACYYKHNAVIKWLIEIKPTINILINDEFA